MCQACEEMELYFAYLEQQEANKRMSIENARIVDPTAQTLDTSTPAVPPQTTFTCDTLNTR